MRVDALPEPVIAFVHRREPAMHPVAAAIEPPVDRQPVSFGDVHHGFVSRSLAGLQGGVRVIVNGRLFGRESLPVIWRVAPGPLFRFDERVRRAPRRRASSSYPEGSKP